MFVHDREEMLKIEARERYEMDSASLKSDGIEEGKQIGRVEGIKIGLKEGIEIAREEGAKSKTIQIAKNMLNHGIDDNLIIFCTEVSAQELESIKKEIS